jgi:ribosomal-protein-serine acetyltransferase
VQGPLASLPDHAEDTHDALVPAGSRPLRLTAITAGLGVAGRARARGSASSRASPSRPGGCAAPLAQPPPARRPGRARDRRSTTRDAAVGDAALASLALRPLEPVVGLLTRALSDDLSLVRLEPHHAEPLFRVVDGNRHFLRAWLPWLDASVTAADTLAFIERSQKQLAADQAFQTALVYRGEIAGLIGHVRIDWATRATALGYWLAEPIQGRGLMTTACRAYLDHSFTALDLDRVEIRAATGNTRSRALPERLGFHLEAVVRDAEWLYDHYVDHAVYGLRRAEWRGSGPGR